MTLTRIFLTSEGQPGPVEADVGTVLALRPDQSKHLLKVLRLGAGEGVIAVDPVAEREFLGRLEVEGGRAQLRIDQLLGQRSPRAAVRTLVQALAKGERNDVIVEKVTELGVSRIIFFQAARSVVRLANAADSRKKQERFQRIAESAAEQSGKRYIPEMVVAGSLAEALRFLAPHAAPDDRRICGSLLPEAVALKSCTPHTRPAHLLIGPEGDLTPEETAAASAAGFLLASLGPYVLRVETAAIAGVAMVEALREE